MASHESALKAHRQALKRRARNRVHRAIDKAYDTSREAIPVAEESGEKYAMVFAYSSYGVSCYGKGFLQEAKKNMLIGNQANERLNQFYMNDWLSPISGGHLL